MNINRLNIIAIIICIFSVSTLILSSEADTLEKPDYKAMLFQAAKDGNLEILKQCIGLVDLNAYDEEGLAPLHHAYLNTHWATVLCLITNGADINIQKKKMHPSDEEGYALIHYAALNGHGPALQFLISLGANMKLPMVDNGLTPYQVAYAEGNREICDILKLYGAFTIFDAIYCNDLQEAKKLLPMHAYDMGVKGRNLLHIAVVRSSREMIQLLLTSGVCVNAFDINGDAPLNFAIWYNRPDIVQLLIDNGANVNIIGNYGGDTPLHMAVRTQLPCLVKMLLNAGANPDAKNMDPKTPYDLAVSMEGAHRNEIIRILRTFVPHHNDQQPTLMPWGVGVVATGLIIYLLCYNYAHSV